MSAEATAEIAAWLEQFSAASEQLKANAAAVAEAAWLSFDGWYDEVLLAAMAKEMSDLSTAAQQTASGLAGQYAAQAIAATIGAGLAPQPRIPPLPIRNNVPLRLVHYRPAEAYKKAIATGATHAEALVLAGIRAAGLAYTDLSLQERETQRAVLQQAGITQYRRVIRPELSETGTCGLCVAAADRIYSTGELMPIHPPSCKCVTMPIVGDNDPGRSLNEADLKALYAAAGSTSASDLSNTRYKVNQHGEHGPVLTKDGHAFRGPDRVALENDPERAARMLTQTLPVLARLEAAGGPAGPLAYQRDLVARLRRIAA